MMDLVLHVWRQPNPGERGRFARYEAHGMSADISVLEMLDAVNEGLVVDGMDPIAFDSDCREGICGSCGFCINGVAHGPVRGAAVCQVYLRSFAQGQDLWLEPFRAKAFPILKDLVVDRGALDRIIAAGGYISVPTGSAPEANTILVPKEATERAFDAAACIGCGACIAACPNASAALFTGAKISHLNNLPQGQPERERRALRMVEQARDEGFGHCTSVGECEAVCPKKISIETIARMNRDYLRGRFRRQGR